MPHIPLVPTGGIGVADAPTYLAAGAVAVGLGSSLTVRLDGGEELAELRVRARRLLAAVSGTPGG